MDMLAVFKCFWLAHKTIMSHTALKHNTTAKIIHKEREKLMLAFPVYYSLVVLKTNITYPWLYAAITNLLS